MKLYKIVVDIVGGTYRIDEDCVWDKIHHLKHDRVSSCNSFAVYESDVASVGEDGRMILLSVKQKCVVRTISKCAYYIHIFYIFCYIFLR